MYSWLDWETCDYPVGSVRFLSVRNVGIALMKTMKTEFRLVQDQISELADAFPDSIALRFGEQALTYGELNSRASKFASYLIDLGVKAEGTVAICMERSFDWIIAALAIMGAGAAYVPLDNLWPDERIQFALKDSGASLILGRSTLLARLNLHIPGVDPLRDAAAISASSLQSLPPSTQESLAYVIYTSGSSGAPKGVEITHANLRHLIRWHEEAFQVTRHDRCSHLAGLGFDAAAWEIWGTLCAGATLCLADAEVRLSPELIHKWITEEKVTIAFVPTVHAESLMSMQWPDSTDLRLLLTGGDRLQIHPPPGLPFAVINNYGPTECTVVATSSMLIPGTEGQPNIGRGITGSSIYLLDEQGKPISNGEPGEIYIGGGGVGRGYRNLPELTASSFLTDPFAGVAGARMYRSGDLGRLRKDGTIEFHGRLDRQIKIRGFRIELDEIAIVLRAHPSVDFAMVTTKLSESGEKQLVAHILPTENVRLASTAELQNYLRLTLPDYMVPPAFMRLHTLPLSASGKIDFELLAQNTEPLMVESITAESSLSPTEGKLLGLIRTLLENPKLSRADNFFLAGGHSLLGMQLVMRLGETFKVNLTLRQLFEAPTVERLATLIDRMLDEQRLAAVWKSLLGKTDVGLDDNFFEVGGDAEMIPPLQARINEEFGKQIPASLLVQNQTIREQIKSMQNLTDVYPSLPSGVLALQSKGTRDGIFWVHYFNVNLAKAVSEDQPFLVVKLMHEDLLALGEAPALENIAARFVTKILATQATGSLTLGGLCLGGILAFEIARQLRSTGREVALLILVDPPDPSILDSRFPLRPKLSQLGYLMKRAVHMGPRMSLLSLRERISSRFAPGPVARLGKTEFEIAQEMIEAAASRYRPGTYDGKVLLLLAVERPPHLDFLPSWRAVVGRDLHAEYIDAHHNDLTNGLNMQRIANAISRHSVEAESPVSSA